MLCNRKICATAKNFNLGKLNRKMLKMKCLPLLLIQFMYPEEFEIKMRHNYIHKIHKKYFIRQLLFEIPLEGKLHFQFMKRRQKAKAFNL